MSDVKGQFFLIKKHLPLQNGKGKKRRHFFGPEEFEQQRDLARKFGMDDGEDFLIVQVVEEITNKKPEEKTK